MDDLSDFDFTGFWEDSDYAREHHVEAPPTREIISSVEGALGFKLPTSFITLCRHQNGGIPARRAFPLEASPDAWTTVDQVEIEAIASISFGEYGLCGEMGNKLWVEEWGYPKEFVYFGLCPSAGHELVALDFRQCGSDGEPSVVYVEQEMDHEITFLAPNFASFVRGLREASDFDLD